MDLKSIGIIPRRFEPCQCRSLLSPLQIIITIQSALSTETLLLRLVGERGAHPFTPYLLFSCCFGTTYLFSLSNRWGSYKVVFSIVILLGTSAEMKVRFHIVERDGAVKQASSASHICSPLWLCTIFLHLNYLYVEFDAQYIPRWTLVHVMKESFATIIIAYIQ